MHSPPQLDFGEEIILFDSKTNDLYNFSFLRSECILIVPDPLDSKAYINKKEWKRGADLSWRPVPSAPPQEPSARVFLCFFGGEGRALGEGVSHSAGLALKYCEMLKMQHIKIKQTGKLNQEAAWVVGQGHGTGASR